MLFFQIQKICIIIILIIYILILIFPILKEKLLFFKIFISTKLFNNILIEFDISAINSRHGPGTFIKGINQILPFHWRKCCFASSLFIKNNNFHPDLYFVPRPFINEKQFKELLKKKLIEKYILGPIFVPKNWNLFPNKKVWKERKFIDILNLTKGIAVHTTRVRDYLSNKTKTIKMKQKYIIIRPCTSLKPTKIKSFKDRKIDILFFEKYADLNRRKQGKILLNLFKHTSKTIMPIKYGSYSKKDIQKIANDSKFIIYFSFFDTGAIGLKEIQNYGVISFTHQKEFVIDRESSFYIPELASINNIELAFVKIINIIDNFYSSNIQTKIIAKKKSIV